MARRNPGKFSQSELEQAARRYRGFLDDQEKIEDQQLENADEQYVTKGKRKRLLTKFNSAKDPAKKAKHRAKLEEVERKLVQITNRDQQLSAQMKSAKKAERDLLKFYGGPDFDRVYNSIYFPNYKGNPRGKARGRRKPPAKNPLGRSYTKTCKRSIISGKEYCSEKNPKYNITAVEKIAKQVALGTIDDKTAMAALKAARAKYAGKYTNIKARLEKSSKPQKRAKAPAIKKAAGSSRKASAKPARKPASKAGAKPAPAPAPASAKIPSTGPIFAAAKKFIPNLNRYGFGPKGNLSDDLNELQYIDVAVFDPIGDERRFEAGLFNEYFRSLYNLYSDVERDAKRGSIAYTANTILENLDYNAKRIRNAGKGLRKLGLDREAEFYETYGAQLVEIIRADIKAKQKIALKQMESNPRKKRPESKTETWERLWTNYINALKAVDASEGKGKHAHKAPRMRLAKAEKAIQKFDPEAYRKYILGRNPSYLVEAIPKATRTIEDQVKALTRGAAIRKHQRRVTKETGAPANAFRYRVEKNPPRASSRAARPVQFQLVKIIRDQIRLGLNQKQILDGLKQYGPDRETVRQIKAIYNKEKQFVKRMATGRNPSKVKASIKALGALVKRMVSKGKSAIARNTAAADREMFAGEVGERIKLYFPKGTPQKGLSVLGPLALLEGTKGGVRPLPGTVYYCRDTEGRIHIGTTEADKELWNESTGLPDDYDFGKVRRVEYYAAKPHIGYPDVTHWFHDYKRPYPELQADGNGGIVQTGGGFTIEREGIVG